MTDIPIRCSAVSLFVLRRTPSGTEVLLLRRTRTLRGQWCQVAGAIEAGETAWQAALRELVEETGLRPASLFSANVCEQFYDPGAEVIRLLPVFVAFVPEEQGVVLNPEHDAYRWLSFGDAMELVPFAGQRHILRHVEQEFVEREPSPLLRIEA